MRQTVSSRERFMLLEDHTHGRNNIKNSIPDEITLKII